MATQVNITTAYNLITRVLKAKLVPMLAGSPGCGKSAIVARIAEDFNLELIDLRLAQCDPVDLLGFPKISGNTGKASYAPMATFPLQGDELPEGKDGWLLFLDEFSSAPPSVQAAAYKLVLDRQIGQHPLHEHCAIVCAGNLETDNAIVHSMSTALQSRLIHLELMVDSDAWLDWATGAGIDHRITSYMRYKPDMLYRFNPDHDDKTYPAPRTWEFTSRLIKGLDDLQQAGIPELVSGTVGEGAAREFIVFTKIYEDLLTIPEIIANPTGVSVPGEPSVLYALTGSIANKATADNLDKLMEFVNRLPIEFQIITLRDLIRRNNKLLSEKPVQDWVAKNSTELF